MIISLKKVFIILFSICKFRINKKKTEKVISIFRVTGGELFEDIVAREFYSEADAR
jgi:hypothetical protein